MRNFTHSQHILNTFRTLQGGRRIVDSLYIMTLPEYHYSSPISLTPKKLDGTQTGWQLIFDLSCPTGSSVNDGIPQGYRKIIYESMEKAIYLVARAGRGAVMMKRDLKSA